ncbi:winged helix-turn-helix domain-containing protein [Sphingomonas sp. LHG3443-2]|uniref:winged helix-turn-helix domain-containing protein n=1 Tax=Sphingomonas sp. LHG3443-2 TaxID=2804639 RepID=UPI003CEEFF4C
MQQEGLRNSFSIGALRVHPNERILETAERKLSLEPLVMRLFTILAERAGQVVARRELFALCWGSSLVGDDSLN